MNRIYTMLRYSQKYLALVSLFTLSCILFVLLPPLNEMPVLVVLSVFTISLAVVACVRRCGLLEGDGYALEIRWLA